MNNKRQDEDIYVTGDETPKKVNTSKNKWIIGGITGIAIIAGLLFFLNNNEKSTVSENNIAISNESNNNAEVVAPVEEQSEEINATEVEIINFEFNSDKVNAQDNLKEFIKKIENIKGKLIIVGHTDNIGNDTYNQTLSERRAKNTANALTELGLKDVLVEIIGMGSKAPLENNDDLNKNRRVELKFEKTN